MGTKDQPGKFDCYAAAADDEPLFVLKSTDISAPFVVRVWAETYRERKMRAGAWNQHAIHRYCEAMEVANEMASWHHKNLGHPDDPIGLVPVQYPTDCEECHRTDGIHALGCSRS